MKKKLFLHFLLFLGIFLLLWFLFSRIDFRSSLRIEDRIEKIEEVLGKWSLRFFLHEYQQIEHEEVDEYLGELLNKLQASDDADHKEVEIYVLRSHEVNAFALPGNRIIFLSGLFDFAESPEEVAGVLAHELAHLQRGHVMQKLMKEIGVATLFTLISGTYNMEALRAIAQVITSTAYDRSLEREADKYAIAYLLEAGIDPQAFLDFLTRIGEEKDRFPRELRWISTHPHPEDRVRALQGLIDKADYTDFAPLSRERWERFRTLVDRFS